MPKVDQQILDTCVGIPWKEDGRDRTGTDCTGLMQLYLNSRGILAEAPKISEARYKTPEEVKKDMLSRNHLVSADELEPEDVMVFYINGELHVALYLGYGKMLHAWRDKKSRISSMRKEWRDAFVVGIRARNGIMYIPPAGDPVTIGIVVGASIAGVVGAGVGFAAGGWRGAALGFFGGLLFGVGGALVAGSLGFAFQAKNRAASADSPRYSFSGLETTSTNEIVYPLVYGEVRMPGNIVYQDPIEGGEDVRLLVIFSQGEIQGFSDIRLNGEAIGDFAGCTYQTFDGTATQNVETSTGLDLGGIQYRHKACIYFNLKTSEKLQGGKPNITAVVSGLKVSTWNGSVWSTEKSYSKNPAACIRDYLLRKKQVGGCGYSSTYLLDNSFGEVYDYSAESVDDGAGGTEARYEMCFAIDQRRPGIDNLREMLLSCAGSLFNSGQMLKMSCNRLKSSVVSLDEDDVTDLRVTGRLYDEDINRLGIEYFDPDQNDVRVVVWGAEDQVSQEERGLNENVISVPSIAKQSQALRLANQFFYEVKINPIGIQFKASIKACRTEADDVFKFTHSLMGWTEKLFCAKSVDEYDEDYFIINAQEYNPSIYNDRYGSEIQVFDYGTVANPYAPVTDVTGLSITEGDYHTQKDGTIVSDIEVDFTGPTDATRQFLSHYQIELKIGSGEFYAIATTTAAEYLIRNVETEVAHQVRVKTVSNKGIKNTGTLSNVLTIQGKLAPPPDVTDFSYTFDSICNLTWSDVGVKDLGYYEIRASDADWISGTANLVFRGKTTSFSFYPESRDSGDYFIRAVDTSGIVSDNAASVSPENAVPAAVDIVSAQQFVSVIKVEYNTLAAIDILLYEIYSSAQGLWTGEEEKVTETIGGSAYIEGLTPYAGLVVTGSTASIVQSDQVGLSGSAVIGRLFSLTGGALAGEEAVVSGYNSVSGEISLSTALAGAPDTDDGFFLYDRRQLRVRARDGYGVGAFGTAYTAVFRGFDIEMLPDKFLAARHITAGELITMSAQIKDGVIENGHILNLAVDKLTGGDLTAEGITMKNDGSIESEDYEQGVSGYRIFNKGINLYGEESAIDADLVLVGGARLQSQFAITEQNTVQDEDAEWEASGYSVNNVTVGADELSLDAGETTGYYISPPIEISSAELGVAQWIENILVHGTVNQATSKTYLAGYSGGSTVGNANKCFNEVTTDTATWVDGTTKWGQYAWARVDLGAAMSISKLKVLAKGYARTWYVQYSTDGVSWNTIGSSSTVNSYVTFTFTPVSARYWRYRSNTFSNGSDNTLVYDMQVFLEKSGDVTVQTRTADNSSMTGASAWAPASPNELTNPAGSQIQSTTDDYLQYRINFSRDADSAGDVEVSWLKINYDIVVAKNANKLGGYEVTTVSAANKIPVLDGSGYLPTTMLNSIGSSNMAASAIKQTNLSTDTGSSSGSTSNNAVATSITLQDYCFSPNIYHSFYNGNNQVCGQTTSTADYKARFALLGAGFDGASLAYTVRYRYVTSSDPQRWLFVEWDTVNNKIAAVWECGDHLTPTADPSLDFELPFPEREGHVIFLIDNSIYDDFSRKEIMLGSVVEKIQNGYSVDFKSMSKLKVERELHYIDLFDDLKGETIKQVNRTNDPLAAHIPQVDSGETIKIKKNIITSLPANLELRRLMKK